MKKPWEQEWFARQDGIGDWQVRIHENQPHGGWLNVDIDAKREDAEAIAKLAAAAPEMARLLKDAEWTSQEAEGGYLPPQCSWCEGYQEAGHQPDCSLLALFRKVGIPS